MDAVRCAVAIQEAIGVANDALPEERRMHFRIGINLGDVMVKDSDIFGDGVNIAARLESLAEAHRGRAEGRASVGSGRRGRNRLLELDQGRRESSYLRGVSQPLP